MGLRYAQRRWGRFIGLDIEDDADPVCDSTLERVYTLIHCRDDIRPEFFAHMFEEVEVKKEPSNLDKRAARSFQTLAKESASLLVECRFRKVRHPVDGSVEYIPWPKGMEEFQKHFGNAPDYFAGALEYIQLATGWRYPFRRLEVMILDGEKQTSGGMTVHWTNRGDIRTFWANGKFTLTVLHELIHLFKKRATEGWVERQALNMTMKI